MKPEILDEGPPEKILEIVEDVILILENKFKEDGVYQPWNFQKLEKNGFGGLNIIKSNRWLYRISPRSSYENFVALLPEEWQIKWNGIKTKEITHEQIVSDVVDVVRNEISLRDGADNVEVINLKWLKFKIPGIHRRIYNNFVDPSGDLSNFEYFITFLPEDVRDVIDFSEKRYERNRLKKEQVIERVLSELEKYDPEKTTLNFMWIKRKCGIDWSVINKLFGSVQEFVSCLPEKWRSRWIKGSTKGPVYLKIKQSLSNTFENSEAILDEYLSSLGDEYNSYFYENYTTYSRSEKIIFFTKINKILTKLLMMRKEGVMEAENKIIELTTPFVETFVKDDLSHDEIIKEIEMAMYLWMGGPDAERKKTSFTRYLLTRILFKLKGRGHIISLDSIIGDDGENTLHGSISKHSIAPGAPGYSEESDITIPDDEFVDRPFDEW